jgi:hypothetical protein
MSLGYLKKVYVLKDDSTRKHGDAVVLLDRGEGVAMHTSLQ